MSKKTINFQETVDPNSTVTREYRVQKDATVTMVTPHFFEGQEFDLELEVYAVDPDLERYESILPQADDSDKKWMGGNDTHPQLHIRHELEAGEKVLVRATNTTGSYPYHMDVQVTIDYETMLEKLTDLFGGGA